jgi:sugar phosphate isomerase/epimerase
MIMRSQLLIILIVCFTFQIYAQEFSPDFFVYEWGLRKAQSDNPEYWADLVDKAGFDGMELMGLEKADKMLPALKKKGLKLYTLYIKIDLDAEVPYDENLKDYIRKWNGDVPYIWLHVHSQKYGPSDPAGDQRCIEIVSELAEFAEASGLKLVFYPHINQWLEKVSDGVRLAEKMNRANVGTSFHLAHFLMKDETDKLKEKLTQAMPYLFLVSINGADDGDTHQMEWPRIVQPLGQGSYDVYHVLEVLKELGYNNPIGLQCYSIEGIAEEFLMNSTVSWKDYLRRLNE